MSRLRTEATVSLTLSWDPREPIDERDVPALRQFLAAIRNLAAASRLAVAGDISLLDRALGAGDIDVLDVPAEPGLSREETMRKHCMISALRRHHGIVAKAARDLEISRETAHSRIVRFGINPQDFKPRRAVPADPSSGNGLAAVAR